MARVPVEPPSPSALGEDVADSARPPRPRTAGRCRRLRSAGHAAPGPTSGLAEPPPAHCSTSRSSAALSALLHCPRRGRASSPPPPPKRPSWRPDRGPLGPPIGGGRWGHPIWAMASEDDASARSIDGAWGSPRRAAMVPTTMGADGDGERRVTAAAVGGGGGGASKSTSMGADVDDPTSINHRHRW
ncbi:hypothetical protein ZEAMMB73_Zm00001d031748 [Zea mays]|uniref:Uncharacterized protein n=1 Tax=Zea mays TaxID=4577 RepID=A0A1D6KL51_MAIZE|nr:hypothetical protein ZEAMMB73_Zm00001d031748 [Zea mays]